MTHFDDNAPKSTRDNNGGDHGAEPQQPGQPGQAGQPRQRTIGIDLGTTNCALATCELTGDGGGADGALAPVTTSIPQVTAPGRVEGRPLLPSFLYLAGPHELPPGALALPWHGDPAGADPADPAAEPPQWAVGELARSMGARIPHRLVSSAKSWLCNTDIDRMAPVLPLDSPPEVPRVSPVEACTRYLAHLRQGWDHALGERHGGQQEGGPSSVASGEVVLTVPASFDAVARQLTVEAAHRAGLANPVLLEEPQAALYAWLAQHGDNWREYLSVGDVVLVCDVGGGTTDFSLIAVAEEEGNLVLRRIAVGDHILLGGDNMDLTLAYAVRARLTQERGLDLDGWQMAALVQSCRGAKEALLATDDPDASHTVSIPGRGSRLLGGAITATLSRREVDTLLLDGFFPRCGADDAPSQGQGLALSEMGLPYAADPGITRHLAQFLRRHRRPAATLAGGPGLGESGDGPVRPTAVLFNGGVFKAPHLQDRLLSILNGWLQEGGHASDSDSATAIASGQPVKTLRNQRHDTSVALGAAYYGAVRQGRGIRIRGGTARSYYIGVASSMPAIPGFTPPVSAVCLAPFGMEEGTGVQLSQREFALTVGRPTRFRLFASSVRKDDQPGAVIQGWGDGEMEELPALQTTLQAEEVREGADATAAAGAAARIPVHLRADVTEVGTLRLSCVERDQRSHREQSPEGLPDHRQWKLEFNLRQDKFENNERA